MPSTSTKQLNLMRAAEHGADFPMAKKVRRSMSTSALHEFATHGPSVKAGKAEGPKHEKRESPAFEKREDKREKKRRRS